jgi:hypothetical protein
MTIETRSFRRFLPTGRRSFLARKVLRAVVLPRILPDGDYRGTPRIEW